MTSSSDRVLRKGAVSERHYRIGEPNQGNNTPIDMRPYSVREVEEQFGAQVIKMQDQHQSALEEAYQSGYSDGSAMARSTINDEVKRITEWIESLASEFIRTRSDWYAENEKQAVETVCLALEQILGERPPIRDHVERALKAAFDQLESGDRATIRCNPQDLAFVQNLLKSSLDEFEGFRRIKVIADEQVGLGGCLVETELGVVDARVEKQLAILKSTMMQHAETRRSNVAAPEPVTEWQQ